MAERIRTLAYKDYEENCYLKFDIINKRTIESVLSYYQKSGTFVDEIKKLDDCNDYYFLKKTVRRNSKYSIDDVLLKNDSTKIHTSIVKKTISHFDSVFVIYPRESVASIFIKIGKRTSSTSINRRAFLSYTKPEGLKKLAIICFQNFKVINSISEYLPLVYYSNSVRYRETLKKTAAKIERFVSGNKKYFKDNIDTFNEVTKFKKDYDSLDKKFKAFIKNKDNIPYSECIEFNDQCLRLQNFGERLAFELSYYLQNDDKEDDYYAIQNSRNDCVFYRGLTDFKYSCCPKVYRNEKHFALEDTTFREYRMRFPEIFEGKTAIESITLM